MAAAATDARDRQHGRFGWVDAARDNGAELPHELARREQHVGRAVRLRGMATAAAQHDVEAVSRGHDRAWTRLRIAERQVGPVVQRIDRVARETLEQALFDHHARAAATLLGRLEDEVHGAVEASCACQLARGAEQHRGVAVVAAAVVHAGDAAGVAEARLLSDRQRIHVGTQADRAGAAALAQCADDAGAGQPFVHLEPEQAQRRGDDAGGAPLLERELGVGVQVAPQHDQIGKQVVDRVRAHVLLRHLDGAVKADAAA